MNHVFFPNIHHHHSSLALLPPHLPSSQGNFDTPTRATTRSLTSSAVPYVPPPRQTSRLLGTKARACPDKQVFIIPPPVLDTSATTPSWVDPLANVHPTAEPEGHGPTQWDAYMRGTAPRNLHQVVRKSRHATSSTDRARARHRLSLLHTIPVAGASCAADSCQKMRVT